MGRNLSWFSALCIFFLSCVGCHSMVITQVLTEQPSPALDVENSAVGEASPPPLPDQQGSDPLPLKKDEPKPVTFNESDGVEYYLPKKLLKLTVNRTVVPSDLVQKTAKAAEDAKTKATEADKAWKVAKAAAELAAEIEKKVGADGKEKAKKNAAILKAEAEVLETKAKEAKKKAEEAETNARNATADESPSRRALEARTEADLAEKKANQADNDFAKAMKDAVLASGTDQKQIEEVFELLTQAERDEREVEKAKGTGEEAAKRTRAITSKNEADTAVIASKLKLDMLESLGKLRKTANEAKLVAEEKQGEAAAALRAAGLAAVIQDEKKFQDEISLEELPMVPDSKHRFMANLNHWWTHEDKWTMTTTETGLLQTAVGEVNDKSGEIIKDLAEIAKEIFKLVAGPPLPGIVETPGVKKEEFSICQEYTEVEKPFKDIHKRPFSAEYTFDPTNPGEVRKVNVQLCRLATKFLIWVDDPIKKNDVKEQLTVFSKKKLLESSEMPKEIDGLLYRRAVPYTIELRERQVFGLDKGLKDMAKNEPENFTQAISFVKKSKQVLLPNVAPISRVSLETGWFITTNYDVGFKDGMLVKMDVKRPSEIHGFVQIPLTLVRDIISLPTELLQLKIDYSSKDTQLLELQKQNFEAQEALKKTLEAINSGASSGNGSSAEP